jgi:hypothetical protein
MLLLLPPRLSDVLEVPALLAFRRILRLNNSVRQYSGAKRYINNVGTRMFRGSKTESIKTPDSLLLCGSWRKVMRSKIEARLVVEPV